MTSPNDVLATRTRLKWTQEQLADALSNGPKDRIHTQTVSAWERGVQRPPPYLKLALMWIERREREGS